MDGGQTDTPDSRTRAHKVLRPRGTGKVEGDREVVDGTCATWSWMLGARGGRRKLSRAALTTPWLPPAAACPLAAWTPMNTSVQQRLRVALCPLTLSAWRDWLLWATESGVICPRLLGAPSLARETGTHTGCDHTG